MLAGRGAGQLLFETGNKAVGAQQDLTILPAGSRNLALAAAPLDIDDDDVAALGRALDDLGFALLLGHALDRPVGILLGHLDNEPLDIKIGKTRLRDIGQHLERHLVFEIGAFAE